jgi:hypothetical protein
MGKNLNIFTSIIAVLIIITGTNAFAQDTLPVNIAFDKNSKRIDLITKKELPNYTKAQRGSIQFFLYRLDEPNDFFNYFHDGVQRATIKSLMRMEKVQPEFAVWRLRYKSGSKNTPRIHHQAISFIPISPTTGKAENRVYLMLNDLELIDWGK